MAFSGDLGDYPLADLLFFLSSHRRSGCLTIQSNRAEIKFALVQGQMVAAQSDNAHHRLGQRLLAEGCIDSVQLETALAAQRIDRPTEVLGSTLVRLGYVRIDDVQRALRAQMVDFILQILICPPCLFFFDRSLPNVHDIEIDTVLEQYVLEAIRRADEWSARQLWEASFSVNPETSADMLVTVILRDWPTVEAIMEGATNLDEIVVATGWAPTAVHESLCRLQALEVIFVDAQSRPTNFIASSFEMQSSSVEVCTLVAV